MSARRSRLVPLVVALAFAAQSALALAHAFAEGELAGAQWPRGAALAAGDAAGVLASGAAGAEAPGHAWHDPATCPVGASAAGARLALGAAGILALPVVCDPRSEVAASDLAPPPLRADAALAPRAPPVSS